MRKGAREARTCRGSRWLAAGGLIALLSASSLEALDPRKAITQYPLDHWRTRDGLPLNSVRAFLQRRDGYLWLGTQEGLARFNGLRFTRIAIEHPAGERFPDVRSLLEDRGADLWVGTYGSGVARLRDGTWSVYSTKDGLPADSVNALRLDREGQIWVGTSGGLARIELGRDGEPRISSVPELRGIAVNAICEVERGVLWIGTAHAGVLELRAGALRDISPSLPLRGRNVTAILADREGGRWLGMSPLGLVRVAGASPDQSWDVEEVQWLLQDRDGNVWAGTIAGVLRIFEGRVFTLTTREGLDDDLSLTGYEDRDGSIWIGTSTVGVHRLRDSRFTPITEKEGLSARFVRALLPSSDGALWIGTYGGGACREKDGRIDCFDTSAGLSNNYVRSIAQTRDGAIWVGTLNGLNRIAGGSITRFGLADGLLAPFVRCVFVDRRGDLWIGLDSGDVHVWNGGDPSRARTHRGVADKGIVTMREDPDGRLWIGTYGDGLHVRENGQFRRVTATNGTLPPYVYCIWEKDGELLLGTNAGLVSLTGTRIGPAAKDEAYTGNIYGIVDDGVGSLWFTSNQGVFRVPESAIAELRSGSALRDVGVQYDEADGMPGAECNGGFPAACRRPDGTVLFPTTRGVAAYRPDTKGFRRAPPPVVIETVDLDEERIEIARAGSVRLPSGKRRLRFGFVALDYLEPRKTRYRYRLEGFDERWHPTNQDPEAIYTNLPPGAYTFRVVASDGEGGWNPAGASFAFEVLPRFTQTIPFYALCVLGVVASAVGGHRLRVRRMKVRERELTRLVDERTRDLERANLELAQLSLTDRLTEIANRRALEQFLDREWGRAVRNGLSFSLLMVDVDCFKAFNDRYGHPAGDECLRGVARALRSSARRPGDLAARWGGEEFVVVLSETDAEGAVVVAERIRAAVEDLQIAHEASPVSSHVTISVGCATGIPGRGREWTSLVRAADEALYRSKGNGRNRVEAGRLDSPDDPTGDVSAPGPARAPAASEGSGTIG